MRQQRQPGSGGQRACRPANRERVRPGGGRRASRRQRGRLGVYACGRAAAMQGRHRTIVPPPAPASPPPEDDETRHPEGRVARRPACRRLA
jgi:hypothetical protein